MTRTIDPRVSDHALLRYLERVYGLDLNSLRREILTDPVRTAIKAGASAVFIAGCKAPVENGTIKTILPKGAQGRMNDSARNARAGAT